MDWVVGAASSRTRLVPVTTESERPLNDTGGGAQVVAHHCPVHRLRMGAAPRTAAVGSPPFAPAGPARPAAVRPLARSLRRARSMWHALKVRCCDLCVARLGCTDVARVFSSIYVHQTQAAHSKRRRPPVVVARRPIVSCAGRPTLNSIGRPEGVKNGKCAAARWAQNRAQFSISAGSCKTFSKTQNLHLFGATCVARPRCAPTMIEWLMSLLQLNKSAAAAAMRLVPAAA